MHEAGLAQAIATLIEGGSPGLRVRLVVSGGHGDPAVFDAALRLHLAAALPGIDAERIQILHRPPEGSPGEPAPPIPVPERIDVVWERVEEAS